MSRHLPSSFVSLRSLAGHAPAVLCVLLLALLSASLASQTRSLRRELAELPAAAAPAPASPSAAPRACVSRLVRWRSVAARLTAGERLHSAPAGLLPGASRGPLGGALIAVAGRSQRFLPGAEVRPAPCCWRFIATMWCCATRVMKNVCISPKPKGRNHPCHVASTRSAQRLSPLFLVLSLAVLGLAPPVHPAPAETAAAQRKSSGRST